MRWGRRTERGFTVIELAVALTMLGIAIMTLSLMFERAMTTTDQVGHDSLAKTLAQEKLEEIRSLPYYISFKTDPRDVDLLDRYFPNLTAPGYSPANGTYTTAESNITRRTAPPFTRTVRIRFVSVGAGGTVDLQLPEAGYDSDRPDVDRPKSDVVEAVVTVTWQEAGRPQQVELKSLIHNSGLEDPKVDAGGTALVAQASGINFWDAGRNTDILALAGEVEAAFREATGSTSQATSDILEVIQRELDTNVPILFGPTSGTASATVPNDSTGVLQQDSQPLASGFLRANDGPLVTQWCGTGPACLATAEARVSAQHNLIPESKATSTAGRIVVNGRRQTDGTISRRMFEINASDASVEQSSTTSSATVTATATLSDVHVWAGPTLETEPAYAGTVTIESMQVVVEATAGTTVSDATVTWRVDNLRVWDPGARVYAGPWTFGYRSDCGGWVGVETCTGDFSSPNPIVLPTGYRGTDAQGDPATSLVILTGATVREERPGTGASLASAGQKNIVSITTRSDVTGAVPLMPMVLGLGDANASVTYVQHEH